MGISFGKTICLLFIFVLISTGLSADESMDRHSFSAGSSLLFPVDNTVNPSIQWIHLLSFGYLNKINQYLALGLYIGGGGDFNSTRFERLFVSFGAEALFGENVDDLAFMIRVGIPFAIGILFQNFRFGLAIFPPTDDRGLCLGIDLGYTLGKQSPESHTREEVDKKNNFLVSVNSDVNISSSGSYYNLFLIPAGLSAKIVFGREVLEHVIFYSGLEAGIVFLRSALLLHAGIGYEIAVTSFLELEPIVMLFGGYMFGFDGVFCTGSEVLLRTSFNFTESWKIFIESGFAASLLAPSYTPVFSVPVHIGCGWQI